MAHSTALNLQPALGLPRKRLRIAIAGGSRAPERARSWIESAASWLPAELESTLLLLTCELVNNAVRHGGAGEDHVIELELSSLDAGRVRVQVSDPGVGFEHSPRNAAARRGGRLGPRADRVDGRELGRRAGPPARASGSSSRPAHRARLGQGEPLLEAHSGRAAGPAPPRGRP